MDNSKNTYKYVLKVGEKVVHRGVTNDLERRQMEHRVRWPDGQVEPVGEKTTMEQAFPAWPTMCLIWCRCRQAAN